MTEYEWVYKSWNKEEGETVEIPDDAIGVTVGSFGDLGTVYYLAPVGRSS